MVKNGKGATVIFILFLCMIAGGGCLEDGAKDGANSVNDMKYQKDRLLSLDYVTVTEIAESDRNKSNVTGYSRSKAYPGINVYCNWDGNIVYFMDMDGQVRHSLIGGSDKGCTLMKPDGWEGYLIIFDKDSLERLDWDSKTEWKTAGNFHHDLDFKDDGETITLTEGESNISAINQNQSITDNSIAFITPDGRIRRTISFAGLVMKNEGLFNRIRGKAGDIFHLNTVEIIKRDIVVAGGTRIKNGSLLICSREMNMIATVDLENEEITWHWGEGQIDGPHNPSVLDNGNILIFDNGVVRNYSRVIELNPATGEIEWEYKADPPESFYSKGMGSAQRLPNGNTLITEATKGHAFEVTREGEVVWDFWEPSVNKDMRKTIYRLIRLTEDVGNLTIKEGAETDTILPKRMTMCDDMKDQRNIDVCFTFIGTELNNATLCQRVKDDGLSSQCLEDVGKASHNPGLCGEIKIADHADTCFEFNAVYSNDTSMCGKLTHENDRARCVGRVAVKEGNPELCMTGKAGNNDWCLKDLAVKLNDTGLCGKILERDRRDGCIMEASQVAGQPKGCQMILEQWKRERCEKNAIKTRN